MQEENMIEVLLSRLSRTPASLAVLFAQALLISAEVLVWLQARDAGAGYLAGEIAFTRICMVITLFVKPAGGRAFSEHNVNRSLPALCFYHVVGFAIAASAVSHAAPR